MNKIILTLAITFGLTQITKAQITCLPCDQLSMSVNVGSDTNALNIYHAGQYLTSPSAYNIFAWEFTDQQGNIIFEDTIVDYALYQFDHNIPITDTMNVTAHLTNESSFSQGNSVNCFIEDQLFWEEGVYPVGTSWGRWEFLHGNIGLDMNSACEEYDVIIVGSGAGGGMATKVLSEAGLSVAIVEAKTVSANVLMTQMVMEYVMKMRLSVWMSPKLMKKLFVLQNMLLFVGATA